MSLVSSSLHQLSEYENLKDLINQYAILVEREEEVGLSDAEVEEIREELMESSQEIGDYSEAKLEEELNATIDLEVKSDLGLSSNGDIVKNDFNVSFKYVSRSSSFDDFLSLDRLQFDLQVNTLKWKINQSVDVQPPSSEEYLLLSDVLKNRKLLEKLGEDSLTGSYINENFPKSGRFYIDDTFIRVGNEHMFLDEPIYIEKGYTMVPLAADGRTFVPIRFVSEQLGGTILWEPENQSITVHFE